MKNSQNVELEAAKFLHKLIQESKDEPTKLAAKLYVVRKIFFYDIHSYFSAYFLACNANIPRLHLLYGK